MRYIGPKLPLSRDPEKGSWDMHNSYSDEIRQNFKNLCLTSPGERVTDSNFGVGLRNMLFELRGADLDETIRMKILEQTRIYMPYVEIEDVVVKYADDEEYESGMSPYEVLVKVFFNIPEIAESNELELYF